MNSTSTGRRPGRAGLPWLVSGFGALSFAFFLGWYGWFASFGVTSFVMGFGMVAAPALGLVWGGYRLERGDIDAARYGRIGQWVVASGVGFLAINVVAIVAYPWYSLAGNIAWAHFSVNVGAVAGFTVGYVEARAIQREVEATAATVRAERLEDEREVLTYLNDLLRHEVLNSAQIIGGHASLLLEDADGRTRRHLETIDRESDALTDVIDDVRAMLNANRGLEATSAVDLSELLTDELSSLDRRVDALEVETEIPASVHVDGNEGIRIIFANLFENAVEHNEREPPRLEVAVSAGPETVSVDVADNGPGIPPKTRETLFERKSENHGLGLYLVRILANRYGGSVELTETGPDGSVFTVTFPRATARDATEPADEATVNDPSTDRASSESGPVREGEADAESAREGEANAGSAGEGEAKAESETGSTSSTRSTSNDRTTGVS